MNSNDIYKTLGISVRFYRQKNGWSQEELADRAGLHPSYVGQIERGVKKISLITLQKISSALKVKISELLSEKEYFCKKTSWEEKILSMLMNMSNSHKKHIYNIVKIIAKIKRNK